MELYGDFLVKKNVIALAALSLMVGSAYAQSSVTLFGIADAGLSYNSNANGARQIALTSGNEGNGRWGLKGVEDLGGGLQTIFTLEAGYSLTSGAIGQNGTEFGRQAFVGLQGSYGAITLGRQYSDAYQAVTSFSAGGTWAASGAGYGDHPGDLDNIDSFNRVNNAIKYQSANYNGFSFGGLYSLGGKAGQFTQNEIYDLSANYESGPVKLGVGYLFVKDPNFSFWGDKANDSTTASNISSPVISGYASAGSEQVISAGASYVFGAARIGIVYSNTQFQNLGSVAVAGLTATEKSYTGTASLNTGELNLTYQFNPALLLGTSFIYTKNGGADGQGSGSYKQIDLGAIYSLSKRTSLYLIAVYQSADGTDSTGKSAVAAITGATPSSSDRQTVVTAGITHKF